MKYILLEYFIHHLAKIYQVFETVLGENHEVWILRVGNKKRVINKTLFLTSQSYKFLWLLTFVILLSQHYLTEIKMS